MSYLIWLHSTSYHLHLRPHTQNTQILFILVYFGFRVSPSIKISCDNYQTELDSSSSSSNQSWSIITSFKPNLIYHQNFQSELNLSSEFFESSLIYHHNWIISTLFVFHLDQLIIGRLTTSNSWSQDVPCTMWMPEMYYLYSHKWAWRVDQWTDDSLQYSKETLGQKRTRNWRDSPLGIVSSPFHLTSSE